MTICICGGDLSAVHRCAAGLDAKLCVCLARASRRAKPEEGCHEGAQKIGQVLRKGLVCSRLSNRSSAPGCIRTKGNSCIVTCLRALEVKQGEKSASRSWSPSWPYHQLWPPLIRSDIMASLSVCRYHERSELVHFKRSLDENFLTSQEKSILKSLFSLCLSNEIFRSLHFALLIAVYCWAQRGSG